MRMFTSHTKTLACWLGMGVLSACTVTVKESDEDKGKPDAAVSSDESSDRDTSSTSDGRDTSKGSPDAGDESGDSVDVTLDGGTTGEEETSGEGDGGTGGGTVSFSCGDRSTDGATVVAGAITEDVTWSGAVHITGPVTVRDKVKVKIEPGTRFIMAVDSSIEFGWNSGAATVTANGTEDKPITFCGEEDDPGFWRSITFGSNVTSNSTFKNVLVAEGGGGNEAALIFDADVHVNNVTVLNSGNVGVEAVDFADDSSELSVIGARGIAVLLTNQAAVSPFPLGGTFEDNRDNYVSIGFSTIDGTSTVRFHDVGIPYVQSRHINVAGSPVVEYAPGVVYKFSSDAYIEYGWNSNDATVRIQGTEEAPVIFEGVEAEAGYWHGVIFGPNVRSSSTVSNWVVRHAGGDDEFALKVSSPIKLTNVTLDANEKGAWISAKGVHKDSANLTITGTEGVPLTVVPNALVTIPQGGDFTGNDDDVIAVDGTSYDAKGTIANLGVPYRLLRYLHLTNSAEMTIAAGNVFQMAADTFIEFGWNSNTTKIVAVGTEEEPIVFKGIDEAPGSWDGLIINSNVTSDSRFEYVTVAHAGNAGNPEESYAVELNAAVTLSHVTFHDIAGWGVGVYDEGDEDLVVDCEATGETEGVILPQQR
jgi:hypothetical protein